MLDLVNHLIWPALILGAGGMAQLIRIMRGSLLEILGQQYITTARAKGLKENVVINKYAVRVAINPLISVMGMQLPNLISRRDRAGHRAVAADHRPAVLCAPCSARTCTWPAPS